MVSSNMMPPDIVRIQRDNYGMAHIFARHNYGLFFGYGYALAEDRLYQLEILKHSTQGRVAEILGADYIEFDKKRRILFDPAKIRAQMAALDKADADIFKGFAQGINKRIAEVNMNMTELMPLEFIHNRFMPGPWTDYDVVMLFVGSMFLRYGDFNTELENQAFLEQLIAQHGTQTAWMIFDAVNPRNHAHAPTTIPPREGQWQAAKTDIKKTNHAAKTARHIRSPAPPIHNESQAASQYTASQRTVSSHDIAQHVPSQHVSSQHVPLQHTLSHKTSFVTDGYPPVEQGFSNALVLGRKYLTNADAVLINGPQFGWYVPAYSYSVGFHTPDWHAVGNAPVGYPLPMFGHNADISWGSTWGAGDNVDMFRETLKPDNPEQYWHKGMWQSFAKRTEIIRVKDAADINFPVYYSVHGPVIHMDKENGYAYARRRGWAGRELDTLTSWMMVTKAKNHAQWKAAVSRSAINVNWYYADRKGNIAYMSSGAYPRRQPGHDNRLPVSGEGDMEWRGIYPPEQNPYVLNPQSGYIANWNNKPMQNFPNPDMWWYSWTTADRIKILNDLVERRGKMHADDVWDVMMQASYIDPNAVYFIPLMLQSLAGSTTPQYRQIGDILRDWDQDFSLIDGFSIADIKTAEEAARGSDTSRGHYSHPANAIFRTWLGRMLPQVLADDLPGEVGAHLANSTAYATTEEPTTAGLNISVGLKLLYETLTGQSAYDFLNGQPADALWLAALDETLALLTEEMGPDMWKWHLPVPPTRFSYKNFLGIPQTLPENQRGDAPDMNRGTENNMTVFSSAPDNAIANYFASDNSASNNSTPNNSVPNNFIVDNYSASGMAGSQKAVSESSMPARSPSAYEIVPPGQSGFIAPNGKRASHYDDQFKPYIRHDKKRVWFYREDIDANTISEKTLNITYP